MIPEERVGVLALANRAPVGSPEPMCLTFLEFLHYGKQQLVAVPALRDVIDPMIADPQKASADYATLPLPATPTPAKSPPPMSAHTQTSLRNTEIALQNDRLILRLPPREAYYELSTGR